MPACQRLLRAAPPAEKRRLPACCTAKSGGAPLVASGHALPQIERALHGFRQAMPEAARASRARPAARRRPARPRRVRACAGTRRGQIIGVGVEEHSETSRVLVGADHPTSAPDTKRPPCEHLPDRALLGADWAEVQKVAAGGSRDIECPQPHFLLHTGFGVMARLVICSPTVPAFRLSRCNALPTCKSRSACQEYTQAGAKSQASAPKWATVYATMLSFARVPSG